MADEYFFYYVTYLKISDHCQSKRNNQADKQAGNVQSLQMPILLMRFNANFGLQIPNINH